MNDRFWLIRGYDSTKLVFEKRVKHGQITETQMRDLIKALAAKAGLGLDEIVGAYATRRTRIANDLLAIREELLLPMISCGTNPFFTATVVDSKGKAIKHPAQ